jgi:tripartite-type tricarboxylate transporter receptor subunit TctC
MTSSTRNIWTTALGTAALLCAAVVAGPAWAQWPERPIKIVVPTPPGGAADTLARTLAHSLAPKLGQPVVIENKPGAAGNIGTVQVARAPADGYTLLMSSVSMAVNPAMYANIGYDPIKDLAPVGMAGIVPNAFFVHPDVKATTLRELLELAKREKLAYSSPGNGTSSHLAAELLFRNLAKVDLLHAPHAPATSVNAVTGGHVQVGSAAASSVIQLTRVGRLRTLALSGRQRSAQFPGVPTVAESGFADFDATSWFALFAPAAVPPVVLDRLNAAINETLTTQAVREAFEAQAIEISPMGRKTLQSHVQREVDRWGRLVRELGIKAD